MSDAVNSTESGSVNVEQGALIASLPEHLQRFDIEDSERGCWIAHKRSTNGYAINTSVKGRKGNAYKLIWEHLNGPVPDGLQLDHYVCSNGAGGCVNPFHLKPVTQRENILRSDNPCAQNARKEYCINGHEFTPENTMRQSAKAGGGRACKACQIQRNKEFADREGREERNRKRREYYARTREKSLAQKRAWREANRQKVAEYRRRENEKRRSA